MDAVTVGIDLFGQHLGEMLESEKMKRIMPWSGNSAPCCRRAVMGNSDLTCSVERQGLILDKQSWTHGRIATNPWVPMSAVPVCAYMSMCMYMCAYACQGQRTTLGVLFLSLPYFLTQPIWHWIYSLSIWLGQLDSKPQVPISSPPTLRLQACTIVLVFFFCMEPGDLNSSLHT